MAGNSSWLRRSSLLLSNFLDLADRIRTPFTPNPDFNITTLEPDYLNFSTMQGETKSRTSTSLCPIWVRSMPGKERLSARCLCGVNSCAKRRTMRRLARIWRPSLGQSEVVRGETAAVASPRRPPSKPEFSHFLSKAQAQNSNRDLRGKVI